MQRKISKKELLAEGRRVQKLVKKLTGRAYLKAGGKYFNQIYKEFGWREFQRKLGIKFILEIGLTDKQLFAEGKRIQKILGKKLFSGREFEKAGGRYRGAIQKRLGWNNFLKKISGNILRQPHVSKDMLLAEGRRIKKFLQKKSFSKEEYCKAGGKYVGSVIKIFGSWNNFLPRIGCKITHEVFISEERFITEGKRIMKLLKNDSFSPVEYTKAGGRHYQAIRNRFIDWSSFLIAIGGKPYVRPLPKVTDRIKPAVRIIKKKPNKNSHIKKVSSRKISVVTKPAVKEIVSIPKEITDDELLAEGKRIIEVLKGSIFTERTYAKAGGKNVSLIRKRFTSWPGFVQKLGLVPLRRMSDEVLIAEVERIQNLLGKKYLTTKEFEKAGGKYRGTIQDRFTWVSFMQKCGGIDASGSLQRSAARRAHRYSNDELFADGKRIMSLLKRKYFSSGEYQKAGGIGYKQIERRFGWGNFLKKIGGIPKVKSVAKGGEISGIRYLKLTDEIIIAEGRRIFALLGKSYFTKKEYERAGGRHIDSIKRRFGWYKFILMLGGTEKVPTVRLTNETLLAEGRRMLELLDKKYFTKREYESAGGKYIDSIKDRLGWQKFLLAIGAMTRVKSGADLLFLCKEHKGINALVKLCKGNEVDVATILSVVNAGWNRSRLQKLLRRPTLRNWMGQFTKTEITPTAIAEASFDLAPHMKNELVKKLLTDRLLEWCRRELGTTPTAAKKIQVRRILRKHALELSMVA